MKKMELKIQRFERRSHYGAPLHCPLCGQGILSADDDENAGEINPCEHTLYVAHDEGWEYLDPRAGELLTKLGFEVVVNEEGIVELIEGEGEFEGSSIDEITDLIVFSHDTLKVASYMGPPGMMGSYVAFTPGDDD
jgi:hypothetical protein